MLGHHPLSAYPLSAFAGPPAAPPEAGPAPLYLQLTVPRQRRSLIPPAEPRTATPSYEKRRLTA